MRKLWLRVRKSGVWYWARSAQCGYCAERIEKGDRAFWLEEVGGRDWGAVCCDCYRWLQQELGVVEVVSGPAV